MVAGMGQRSEMLTVQEAASVLRIGRTAAYQLARRWRETEGREGLPVVRLGRLLRVPRAALGELLGSKGGELASDMANLDRRGAPDPVSGHPESLLTP
ncbi:MAG: helix-turn-helix domain-containing protein [Actinomycetota bacterium]|nr:helix-turn-helix domain-containing protein [Actinomycetota bacterium]